MTFNACNVVIIFEAIILPACYAEFVTTWKKTATFASILLHFSQFGAGSHVAKCFRIANSRMVTFFILEWFNGFSGAIFIVSSFVFMLVYKNHFNVNLLWKIRFLGEIIVVRFGLFVKIIWLRCKIFMFIEIVFLCWFLRFVWFFLLNVFFFFFFGVNSVVFRPIFVFRNKNK